jgi:predicted nucleotidyltransferase
VRGWAAFYDLHGHAKAREGAWLWAGLQAKSRPEAKKEKEKKERKNLFYFSKGILNGIFAQEIDLIHRLNTQATN